MLYNQRIIAQLLTLIFSFFLNSCTGQISESIPVTTIVLHQDSISASADTLPEYRVGVNDTDYQGNQISGVIRTVFQDSRGHFWFGTQSGLCRYTKEGLVYFNLVDWNNQGVTIHAITEDTNGNIWIGYGGGIAKYDGSYFTLFHHKDILTKSGLWSMEMDRKGILWIGTTQGAFMFDGEALTPFHIPEGEQDSTLGISSTKMIHFILEDSKGKIWFATNGGVYTYDGVTLNNISKTEGLPSNFVNKIVESSEGSFWISTSNGLSKYNENDQTLVNVSEQLLGTNKGVACIVEDHQGNLWFSSDKRDIYNFDGNEFTKIEVKEGDFSPFPFEIYEDQLNRLWFVGFKGAYRLENDSFVNVNRDGPW